MADEQKGTEYVVLRRVANDDADAEGWVEVHRVTAANDVAAIRAADKAHGPFDSGAVAVPARSWRPRKPTNETIQRRLWS